MRALLAVALASLALVPLAAPAAADHMGPCTHQYAEIVLYGVLNAKNGGLKTIGPGVMACVKNTGGDLPVLP